jgi:hypothetical protein
VSAQSSGVAVGLQAAPAATGVAHVPSAHASDATHGWAVLHAAPAAAGVTQVAGVAEEAQTSPVWQSSFAPHAPPRAARLEQTPHDPVVGLQ